MSALFDSGFRASGLSPRDGAVRRLSVEMCQGRAKVDEWMPKRRRLRGTLFAALLSVTVWTSKASACAVCFGDPNSAMAKGAVAGVAVLVGIVAGVLLMIAGIGVCWMIRGRRLARQAGEAAAAPGWASGMS